MQQVLIVGGGYSGLRLAKAHRQRGDAVVVAGRRAGGTAEFIALDLDSESGARLPAVDRVYYTVPPSPDHADDIRLRRLLASLTSTPKVFVYFGATSVYAAKAADIVDENTPPRPDSARGQRRLAAENRLRDWSNAKATPLILLRITAIYGPGRLPVDAIRQGEPVLHPDDAGPGNRIHVDDLVNAAICAADTAHPACHVINICDGDPATTAEFRDTLARLLALPPPPRVRAAEAGRIFTATQLSYLQNHRRIDNRKMCDIPGFVLKYPTHDSGLFASLRNSK